MRRQTGVGAAAVAAVALLAVPAGAAAHTKTVYAGPPPAAHALAVKILGKKFVTQNSPDVNDFFQHRVTINTGDTVSFVIAGFHTIDLPGAGQGDLPLLTPGSTVSGINDAAGNPFWFNGKVPNVGINPALFAPSGGTTYDGTTRIDSGLPLGPAGAPQGDVHASRGRTSTSATSIRDGRRGRRQADRRLGAE